MGTELHGDWFEICGNCGCLFVPDKGHKCPPITQETVERVLKALEDIASGLKRLSERI